MLLATFLVAALLLLPACAGDQTFVEPRTLTAGEISGVYRSDGTVGPLGILTLELARVEQSRVYAARFSGEDEELFGVAEAIGTLAEDHLVLHIDRGQAYDYYFEGTVLPGNGSPSISGEFIFPDQAENLVVSFSPVN